MDPKSDKKIDKKARLKNAGTRTVIGGAADLIDTKPKVDSHGAGVNEAVSGTAVVAFGRMNPPTIGHQKLVDKVQSLQGDPFVVLTHTQDKRKNPLKYGDKVRLARKAFGNAISMRINARTVLDVMKTLQGKYSDIIFVAGSDRVSEFNRLLNKYNGREYNFNTIKVVSAGERDPDDDGASGMSASKMRSAAASGDLKAFKSGLPNKLKSEAKQIMNLTRAGLGMSEQIDEVLTITARRKKAISMRRFRSRLVRSKKQAQKRRAKEPNLQRRAQLGARKVLRKKVAGKRKGGNYSKLSYGQRAAIDKMVARKGGAMKRLTKRMKPKVRKAEAKRLSTYRARLREERDLINKMIAQDPQLLLVSLQEADNIFEADSLAARIKQRHELQAQQLKKRHATQLALIKAREKKKREMGMQSNRPVVEQKGAFAQFIETGGAGEWGTKAAVDKYVAMTPGQDGQFQKGAIQMSTPSSLNNHRPNPSKTIDTHKNKKRKE